MSPALTYRASLFEPTVPPDLGDKAVRKKLSKSALTGFFTLVAKWHIRDEDARELLRGRPPLAYRISGGLLAMQTVRSLIDARQGGLSGAFRTYHELSPI